MSARWPTELLIVRHGQSAGNVARDAAEAAGLARIDIATRDCDVPLSPLGEQQADALGQWFGERNVKPTVALSSPYLRAQQTAARVLGAAKLEAVPLMTDERLREKEFGILDRMTRVGITEYHPAESEAMRFLGKFYFRPPGGESWCDVILRLRSVVESLDRDYHGERVLIVSHQVVVLCMRYLLERMTEEQILTIDREHQIANCGVTTYRFDPKAHVNGALVLQSFDETAPLEEVGAPLTSSPDVPVARK